LPVLILHVLIGITVLLFGRRLFWLFVACSGFMVGVEFSKILIPQYSQWIQVAVAMGVGVLGAVLAVVAQRIAFIVAGALAGLYLVFMLMAFSGYGYLPPGFFLVAGILGAVAGFVFIDWAIIGFSALVGAGVVVNALHLPANMNLLVFAILSVIGIWIQWRQYEATTHMTSAS